MVFLFSQIDSGIAESQSFLLDQAMLGLHNQMGRELQKMDKNTKTINKGIPSTFSSIKLDDLPPRKNAIGGFRRTHANFEFRDLDAARPAELQISHTPSTSIWMRLLCIAILSASGALFTSFLVSLIVDGWVVLLGSCCIGGGAGLMLAALFWASG